MQHLNHKHFLATATGLRRPPRTSEAIDLWLRHLVDRVSMKILMGPYSIRCETLGNEGVTGIVCIETSHASIHVWDTDTVPFLKFDLYSCMDFCADDVIQHLAAFEPTLIDYMVVDRNGANRVIAQQRWLGLSGQPHGLAKWLACP